MTLLFIYIGGSAPTYPGLRPAGDGVELVLACGDLPADYLEWVRDKSDLKEDVKFSAAHWLSVRSRA